MRRMWGGIRGATGLAVALLAVAAAAAQEPPAGFQRFFPRGHIPTLDTAQYVPAKEAEIPPDAWVLGVVVDGTPLAYELNLLTRNEVINDRVGDRPVAVVYCPLANSVAVYDRRVGGRELRFDASGVLMHGAIVIQDRETESYWPLLESRALYGPLLGTSLVKLPGAAKVRWSDWLLAHPDTLVWSLYGQERLDANPMARYLASSQGFRGMAASDDRLATKEPVFGFERSGRRWAAAASILEGGRVFPIGEEWVLLHRPRKAALNDHTRAYVSRVGFTPDAGAWVEKGSGARFDAERGAFVSPGAPEPIEGFDTFWYVWSLTFPDTALLGHE
jgi:hypothetical protein